MQRIDRVGETNIANNGMKMTIIAYRGCDDIDIQFEDGTIVFNKRYMSFKNNTIGHPTIKTKIDRTGETNIANNGMKMTIIAYRKNNDIDVQFEDGTIVYNKPYINFKKGQIGHPTAKTKINRIGETNIANNGLKMTIIAYRGYRDIDIRFEDGAIVYNKVYDAFYKGAIEHPIIKTKKIKTEHVGDTSIAKNNMKMTVITYRKYNDIDIQFEDGTIVYNRKYNAFKNGEIEHPIEKTTNRVGETNIANNGLKMTIIAYRGSRDIDIRFEDGIVVYNKHYVSFKNGKIGHPTVRTINNHTGETNIAKNSLQMTIIAYRKHDDIDIRFEDNTIVYNKRYEHFKDGTIKHPNIINDIKLKEFAYKINDDWYYICSHLTWAEDKILSVNEIYAYQSK